MSHSEMIDLGDLSPRSQDFKVRNKSGQSERYVVREASAKSATAYRNMLEAASRYEDGKFVGTDGLSDCEPFLVGQCVFQVDDKGGASPIPVGMDTVLSWPDRIQSVLYQMVQDLSPKLNPRDTPERLQEQIDRLTKRREELLELRRTTSPNVQAPGSPGSSDSVVN